ncbi:MAG: DUF4402 domain-containing protein [Pedobacter sp.]|nr:MAG: DUF4402 domain-containing protein [Pedobacter sp.]
MKTKSIISKTLFSAILLAGFATASQAQATATATATATIVTPISIANVSNMSFGNISVQASNGGTVELDPAGARTRTAGVTLPGTPGTVSAATFTVTGTGGYTYAIILPTTVTLTRASGTETMDITSFVSNPSGVGLLSGGGTQDFSVGATLTVAAGQAAGVYTSNNFDVTVNYN